MKNPMHSKFWESKSGHGDTRQLDWDGAEEKKTHAENGSLHGQDTTGLYSRGFLWVRGGKALRAVRWEKAENKHSPGVCLDIILFPKQWV